MPEVEKKAGAAEDAVEKTAITAETVAAAGENMEEVQQALEQTELSAKLAQSAVSEARIFLNSQQGVVRKLESEKIRAAATADLANYQTKLQALQTRLNPLKCVRQDWHQKAAAKKLVTEVLEKLAPAEVDVVRAEEATLLLSGGGLNRSMLQEAEQAVTKASDHLIATTKFVEQKKNTASGVALQELSQLEERIKSGQQKMAQLRSSLKEAAERVTSESLLKEAADKLKAVEDSVAKAADAETPFLMGIAELPLDETKNYVKTCDAAATAANTAASIARMFLATKMVEAKRYSAGPSSKAQSMLQEYHKQLDAHTKCLAELKSRNLARKQKAMLREAESQTVEAESLAQQMTATAAVFEDETKLKSLSPDEIRKVTEETSKAEAAANTALADARKFVTSRQIEAKGKDGSVEVGAEFAKFQARISSAQAEVQKFKKLCNSVEERLAAMRLLEEATEKLSVAETQVNKATDLLAKSNDEEGWPDSNAVTAAEAALNEGQSSLRAVEGFIDTRVRSKAHAREEVTQMQPRFPAAVTK